MSANENTNIIVKGMVASGSSALYDLLREYDSVGVIPSEFDEFRKFGMVGDHLKNRIDKYYPSQIESYLRNKKSKSIKSYIKRFILKIPFMFPYYKKQMHIREERSSLLRQLHKYITENNNDNKIEKTKKWIQDIGKLHAPNKKFIIFDQAIMANQHDDIWPLVFDPFKLIVVCRNPKDQMAEIIYKRKRLYHDWSWTNAIIYGGGREGAIEFSIDTLKSRIYHIQKLIKEHGSEKVLVIMFEDLVCNYNKTKKIIEKFIGLNEINHLHPFKFFKPELAKKSIGIKYDHLHQEEIKKLDKIEKELNFINR